MVQSKKGHYLVNISRNSLKNLSGHLNIYPKLYAKYENPSSSSSQVIVLTRFFMTESKKGHNFAIKERTKKIVLMLHIKFQVPSSSRSLVLQPTTMLYW